ncbi:MAG: hypothetical protein FJW40_23105 [Acidobacteria bacterium]|nr:hypothetical protein [Acidobacteriota bacterium]
MSVPDRESPIFRDWVRFVYGEGHLPPRPVEAEALLAAHPWLADVDPFAAGRLPLTGAPATGRPPLAAVTQSSLGRLRPDDFEACVRTLLDQGADPNTAWLHPSGSRLSALYGAAGITHNARITRLLLEAGANPNDGESLYHSLEAPDTEVLKLLLAHGALPRGNELRKALDYPAVEPVRLLLAAGADANYAMPWAIRRRRPHETFLLLLEHGAIATPALAQEALRRGLTQTANHLRELCAAPEPTPIDRFLTACATADEAAARAEFPGVIPPEHLRLLPDQVEAGNLAAARLMVELGWPIDAPGGDWNASALNLAVFRGNPELTRFLLSHGADWRAIHGFGADVRGTLAYASVAKPVPGGDWEACARVLADAGVPLK